MFGGISSHWGVHHVPQVLSQDSKWFERSIDRKFGADLWVVFWVVPGDPDTCGQVTRRGGLIRTLVAGWPGVALDASRWPWRLWPDDPVGLILPLCCSSSFVLASALLPSLSSFVPKVSRAGFFTNRYIYTATSGNGIPLWYKWYTASYRSNSKSKPESPIQTVTSGIPRYKLFILLRYKLKPLRNELRPPQWKRVSGLNPTYNPKATILPHILNHT
jgi:hypothetical protein